jgi:subtilase family protein
MRRSRRVAALLLSGGVVAGVLFATGGNVGASPKPAAKARPATAPVPRAALERKLGAPAAPAAHGRVPALSSSLYPAAGLTRRPVGTAARGVPLPDAKGNVKVYVRATTAQARQAVAAVGGKVLLTATGLLSADVPAARLTQLAGAPGITQVRPPITAVPETVTSEGVAASSADVWHTAQNNDGTGVKIGIVDAGFANLAQAQNAGEIPAGAVTFHGCHDSGGADLFNQTNHGTAVAEIVHDMAPGAQLYLACINDSLEFGAAEQFLRDQGVKIVNTSLTFPGEGRGDGSGDDSTTAGVVKRSRLAGVLWAVSAGNQADVHYSSTVRDTTGPNGRPDGFVEINGTTQNQGFAIAPGSSVLVSMQWDAWPRTTGDLDLIVTDQNGTVVASSLNDQAGTPGGLAPVEEVVVNNPSTTDVGIFFAFINIFKAPGGVRYDITAYDAIDVQFNTPNGSVGEPASSPYVIAAGAVDVSDNQPESFSSQGPTIDGRSKPEIAGYDGVSTLTFGPPSATTGFFGTSAAAPHVAGAAALISAKNSTLDASGIERELFNRAIPVPGSAPNITGRGRLSLVPTDVPPARAAGLTYNALATPTRILDTRHGTGGRSTPLGTGEVFPLQVTGVAGVPADARAVVVNLTGVQATSSTDLSVFPDAFTGTSNLNLVRNQAAANLVTATLSSDGKIRIRNAGGTVQVIVDVVGYYAPTGNGFSQPSSPVRVLDTRNGTGGTTGKVGPGQTITLPVRGVAGVPAGATAVVLNLTGTQPTSTTDLSVFPDTFTGTSNLNLTAGATRANLVVATIGADGNIRIRNAGGMTHVIADLAGWFQPGAGSQYVPFTPKRIMDTRSGNGLKHGPFTANQVVSLQAARINTVPTNATGVVLNVTGVGPSTATFLTLFPTGQPRPGTSNVNLAAGQIVPNAAYASVGATGQVDIANSAGTIQVLVDIAGYFQPAS